MFHCCVGVLSCVVFRCCSVHCSFAEYRAGVGIEGICVCPAMTAPLVEGHVHWLDPRLQFKTGGPRLRAPFWGISRFASCAGVSLGNKGGNSIARGCSCLQMGDAQPLEVCRVVIGDSCERVLGMITKACGQGESCPPSAWPR
jgi:hypothetical protein